MDTEKRHQRNRGALNCKASVRVGAARSSSMLMSVRRPCANSFESTAGSLALGTRGYTQLQVVTISDGAVHAAKTRLIASL